jgi:hypothetical protein
MPYSVKHDPVQGIVEVTLTGPITGADLRAATTECTSLQKQTGATRFLIDANGWDVSASLVDIYEIPTVQYWREGLDRHSLIATIFPGSASGQQAANFYETVCQNRGWHARVFPDRQGAVAWLRAGGADSPDTGARKKKKGGKEKGAERLK